ncbi:MAG: hypothetical protein RR614_14335, partial [Eubacterium sp.]
IEKPEGKDNYEVTNINPGMGWANVAVTMNNDKGESVTGKRAFRIVPVSSLSLDKSDCSVNGGKDSRLYTNRLSTGGAVLTQSYNHENGVRFTKTTAAALQTAMNELLNSSPV